MKQTEEAVKPASLSAPVAMKKVVPEVDTPKDLEMTDEERSKNSTPLTIHQGDLGDTSPAGRKAGDEAHSDVSASPQLSPTDKNNTSPLPTQAQPLPAPVDVDNMALPIHDESVPYWERLAPLPAPGERPGTSSRRPQSSAGKITIYQTEKQKKLKAEARKKREADSSSPSAKPGSLPPVSGATGLRSALPPLKERKKKSKKPLDGLSDDSALLAPVKPVRDWKGSSGGEAWEVATAEVSANPEPEVLKFDSPRKEGMEVKMSGDFVDTK